MKWYLVIFICMLSASAVRASTIIGFARMIDINIKDVRQCVYQSNLTDKDMMKLDTAFRNVNVSVESLDEFQLNLGCFIVCILDKAHLMENNDILLDILIETAERNDFPVDEITKQKLNECFELATEQDDQCKRGYVFAFCFINQ
ncbi:uncharacterized protein LOC122534661 [Frieseomelitta varia]|uniref:uncharacterized protein LOC122534661 n=1 Tax=Frieseomelitta varia TaxID=561572 RepID=UPI001CB67BAD|nr:uncharacterized protein LOC122534661 [Frieseomelitta varia]XP_043521449.1 uncharacterized protein LOC122534661 [Frieseomelitta varia]XP_043521450.1 uncharacterized protein LOC122534661 [Frieseomelitta varia]